MKKRAIIYTRVSTDEQNNGYSPADQKDKLYRYCENNDLDVVGFYHDDESAKTFNRPEWIKIMKFIKMNKGFVDYIYFLKWDRFSRNVAEAFIEIKELRKLGVEPRAIEQPLDFKIPESKIMLSIYLAAPEVDNDRRALNVFHGIRRGKKEGRWLGTCIKGYKNARDENNKPIIIPEGGQKEQLVKKAFTEFATGLYNIEQLRGKLNKEGFKANRNSFWAMLRNKGYIGKVLVPAFENEKEEWVQGKHQPLIDEQTFYTVQDILAGRKKNIPNKFRTQRDELPLRGFLLCPQCGKRLTGSASTGRKGDKFFYYHCSKGCKERQVAEIANHEFENILSKFKSNELAIKLQGAVLKDRLQKKNNDGKAELEKVGKEIAKQKVRIQNAKELMLDGEFSATEYKNMKLEIEEKIDSLSREEANLRVGSENQSAKVQQCLEILVNLHQYYVSGDTSKKQRIIGSIFPEKLTFENQKYRTTKVNWVVSMLCSNIKDFKDNKKGKGLFSNNLSLRVVPPVLKPFSFLFSYPRSIPQ